MKKTHKIMPIAGVAGIGAMAGAGMVIIGLFFAAGVQHWTLTFLLALFVLLAIGAIGCFVLISRA